MVSQTVRGSVLRVLAASAFVMIGFATSATSQAATPARQDDTSKSADTGLAEIIVTARRHEEDLQSVPVSVTVINPEDFVSQGVRSAMDLQMVVPGLKYAAGGASFNGDDITFAMRGQAVTPGTRALAVIPYFSDVPLQSLTTGQMFDITSVQALRGPQGTLFGRVTDGGAILLNPVKPGSALEGYATAQLGTFNLREFQGGITLPMNDKISFRLAADITRRDGFTKNIFNGVDLDDLSWETVRLGMVIKPFEGFENYTVLSYNHSSTRGNGLVLEDINLNDAAPFPCCDAAAMQAALAEQRALGPRTVDLGLAPGSPTAGVVDGNGLFFKRRTIWAFNTTTWQATEALTIKNIFGYQSNRVFLGGAAGYSGLGFQFSPYLPASNDEQYSNELQAQGVLFNSRLAYTTGGYLEWVNPIGLNENLGYLYDGAFVVSTSSYNKTRSKAAYAQIAYEIVDGLKLNAGIRRTHDKVNSQIVSYFTFGDDPIIVPHGRCVDPASLPAGVIPAAPCDTNYSGSFKVSTYTLGLDYQISPKVFTYLSLRKGYRPGGINTDPNAGAFVNFAPENVLSRELGIKTTYGSGAVIARTNLALYYDTLRDSQQYRFTRIGDQGATVAVVINAPSATMKGFELEQTVRLFNALTFNASYAYLDASWDRSKFNYTAAQQNAACPADRLVTAPDPTLICPLDPFPQSSKQSVTASIDYDLPVPERLGKIQIDVNGFYSSKVFQLGGTGDRDTIPSHTVYNASATWKSGANTGLSATLFVNNLTDKLYSNTGFVSALAAGSFGTLSRQYAPPRMWGISATYRF